MDTHLFNSNYVMDFKYALLFTFIHITHALDRWEPLRIFLDLWQNQMVNFTVQIANETHGIMFDWSSKNFSSKKVVETDSSSKFVSGIAILSILGDETLDLSYDTKAGDILPFWSNDTADIRSRVNMKHLLSLTSGYTMSLLEDSDIKCDLHEDIPDHLPTHLIQAMQKQRCRMKSITSRKCTTFVDCVKESYRESTLMYEPGTIWDYNGFNLQTAGAVVEVATGRPIQNILAEFMKKVGMVHSRFEGGAHIQLDGSLHASTDDYMTFLTNLVTGKILSPELYDSLFNLNTDSPVEVKTLYSYIFRSFIGRYSITNWYECPFDLDNKMRPECISGQVHSCAGLSGFYPMIDHKLKYWMVIGHKGYPAIGCTNSIILRLAIKPYIDEIITGKPHAMDLNARLEKVNKDVQMFNRMLVNDRDFLL